LGDRTGGPAAIIDIYENAEIRVLMNERMRADGLENATAWIGMVEHVGSYTWHNTCPVVFSNFENLYGKPENNASCVGMRPDGKWVSAPCDTPADYVVCERRFGKNHASAYLFVIRLIDSFIH